MRAATFGNYEGRTQARRTEQFDGAENNFQSHTAISLGAALTGWLVTVVVGVLLTFTVVITGSGLALTITDMRLANLTNNALFVTLIGACSIIATFALAYFAGGYIAGKMSGSDGARQGLGVWIIGSIVTVALVIGGVSMVSSYGLVSSLNLASLNNLASDTSRLTAGSLLIMAAVLCTSALSAVSGGRVGAARSRRPVANQ